MEVPHEDVEIGGMPDQVQESIVEGPASPIAGTPPFLGEYVVS
jgi:hypothetical protein